MTAARGAGEDASLDAGEFLHRLGNPTGPEHRRNFSQLPTNFLIRKSLTKTANDNGPNRTPAALIYVIRNKTHRNVVAFVRRQLVIISSDQRPYPRFAIGKHPLHVELNLVSESAQFRTSSVW